ncbi:enoyl-CoA hydratase-related protein [Inhella gelatinilytica]|uniref:Enoyl-CoA hydratase/isomerase family protein n=1 Tax=Inhella gelatinilytica TaxID=2795030 RepID=A0A931IXW1_9BURK|nr:enoyl-CoA hydratase-related protein [Inhella gelatinilytica]MBH9553917.1 enoyl-CoA hydratase/isomerase family protein [Inhella gelatinilytica]
MNDNLLLSVRSDGVALLALNRPDRFNAFDEDLIDALKDALERCAQDPAVRVVLLSGEGKHFCAGADIGWMQRAAAAPEADNRVDAERFAAMLAALAGCPKPTVARVQGLALGGGAGLVAACDIAIATQDAAFAISEARFGILPAVIGPYVLRAVGPRQAQRLALMAHRFSADEALRLGLVHQVVASEGLDEAMESTLTELLASGPAAQAEIKALFAQLRVGDVGPAVQQLTAQTIARVRTTPEAREGFAAFTEKRLPTWNPDHE